MASPYQHNTFGASIVPTITADNHADTALLPSRSIDSPVLTPAVSHEDMSSAYENKPIPPHSPFYQHPPASFERAHSRNTSKTNINAFEKDVEAGGLTPLSAVDNDNPFTSKVSIERNQECKMWPSKQTLMQERAAEKHKKHARRGVTACAPLRARWAKFDKKQRLIIKIILALPVGATSECDESRNQRRKETTPERRQESARNSAQRGCGRSCNKTTANRGEHQQEHEDLLTPVRCA